MTRLIPHFIIFTLNLSFIFLPWQLNLQYLISKTVFSHDSELLASRKPGQGNKATTAPGQVNVLTQHNDNGRTGANLNETTLNTANVNVRQFGKLFSRTVDGYIYAQPLYASQINIPGRGLRNVVLVATERNNIYAFDADDASATAPFWAVNLGTPVPGEDISLAYSDLVPEIGITGTPVIDINSQTIYVVAKSKDLNDNSYHQKLYALDLATGKQKFGGSIEITAIARGVGDGNVNGQLTFDPLIHLNRPALLLLNGVVYLAFGSHGDLGDYHGWVLGYDAKTFQQVAVFNTSPDGNKAAIWHSGQGLVADENNNIYLVTSNGTFSAKSGGRDFGDTALKLSTKDGLTVTDWFTPYNEDFLNRVDGDLGSGGPLLLPGINRLVICGKDSYLRLLDTNNMGRFDPKLNRNVQEFRPTDGVMLGSPVYWNSEDYGPAIYFWASIDYLKIYKVADGKIQFPQIVQGNVLSERGVSNSPPMSLSANGDLSGTGIIWATGSIQGDANARTVPGVLRAVDAIDGKEIWNSKQNSGRDDIGSFAKFCPPTVANGKVYVPTFSNQLHVFGLLPGVCNYSLGQANQLVISDNDSGTFKLTVEDGCNWLVNSNDDWINVTSGNEGSGNETITYAVDPNLSAVMRTGTITAAGLTFTITQAGAASLVSAASYDASQLASESIATAYGSGLATGTGGATSGLPTSLFGTSVTFIDSTGLERLSPLFYVSPTQINYLVPQGTALGEATVKITSGNGNIATGTIQIARVAAGLFAANSDGQGVAAAVALRVKADNSRAYEPVIQPNSSLGKYIALPIDLGPDLGDASDQVYLILYGTGLRSRNLLSDVKAKVGGVDVPVIFAGPQGDFAGLDQVNLLLPRTLAGRGEAGIELTVENNAANVVTVSIK